MFKSATEAERAERDQDADFARIDAAIDSAEKNIAALGSQQPDPDKAYKKWSVVRDETILAIQNVRHNMVRRANEAKATETWLVVKFLREAHDDMVIREFTSHLQEVPTENLVDYLRYLIQIGDVARIQSLAEVFAMRNDHQRYSSAFGKMLTEFTLSRSGSIGKRIPRIYLLAEKGDARVVDVFCGRSPIRLCAPTTALLTQVDPPMISALGVAHPYYAQRNRLLELA
jgi:hypothetical protein